MTKPILSIVVAAYNAEKTLDLCLCSISYQQLQDFECIIVNNNSTDKTVNIAKHWCEKDSHFKLVDQEIQGCGAARNKGLEVARGKYIGFVDADDFIEPSYYYKLVHLSEEVGADTALSDVIYDNKSCSNRIEFYDKTKVCDRKSFLRDIASDRIPSWPGIRIYRREILKDFRFVNGVYEDYFAQHLLYYKCKEIVYLHEPLYHYMYYGESLSRQKNIEKEMQYLIAKKERYCFFKKIDNELARLAAVSLLSSIIWSSDLMLFNAKNGLSFILSKRYDEYFNKLKDENIINYFDTRQKIIFEGYSTKARPLFCILHRLKIKATSGVSIFRRWMSKLMGK